MRPEQEWPSEVWWQLSEENLAAAERTMEDNGGHRRTTEDNGQQSWHVSPHMATLTKWHRVLCFYVADDGMSGEQMIPDVSQM